MNTKTHLGTWGENYAAKLYKQAGFIILVQNSFNPTGKRLGEIDFVAQRKQVLCFVEVKTRISTQFGLPEESISFQKRKRLIRSAQWFISKHGELGNLSPRIDVCAILLSQQAEFVASAQLDKFVKYSKIMTNAVDLN